MELEMLDYYQCFVHGLASREYPTRDHAILGIASEFGEICDYVRKCEVYKSIPSDGGPEEEIGDLMFFVALLANSYNLSLEDILQANMEKLNKRYPSGSFNREDAIARRDKNEK